MIEYHQKFYKEIRCYKCRRLLGWEYIYNGRLMIKCPWCNFKNSINYKTPPSLMKKIDDNQKSGKLVVDEVVLKKA